MPKKINSDLLRIKLSISQKEFADYLGITRSQLTMYEQGLRSLPTPALIKLSNLELINHDFEQGKSKKAKSAYVHPEIQKHNEKAKKQMKEHVAFCQARKTVLQNELDEMIKEHSRSETWSRVLDEMLLDTGSEKQKKEDQSWLVLQKGRALKKMIRHGTVSQAKLQALIHVLGAEANVYKTLHEKL